MKEVCQDVCGQQAKDGLEKHQPPHEELDLLGEIRSLRQEHKQAATENRQGISRVEKSMQEVINRMFVVEKRTTEMEERAGLAEERTTKLEKAVVYLFQNEAKLMAKCNDLEARERRKNIRICGVPEGSEKDDMVGFVKELISFKLKLLPESDIDIEKAHRVGGNIQMRSTTRSVAPRAIIVRFCKYRVKENVIQAAWKQRHVYQGRDIYFNQDYTAEVQKERTRVREVIRKLKEKNVKAQTRYPAQLRIFLEGETKTFSHLKEATGMLREMGIFIEEDDETEKLKKDMQSSRWNVVTLGNRHLGRKDGHQEGHRSH